MMPQQRKAPMQAWERNAAGETQRLTPEDLDALKRAHPIAEMLARYGVALTRSGVRLVGLCPLHEETRPSFTVFPESGRFRCFGCGQGGDVIELVRAMEGIGFREAVERLQGGLSLVPRPAAASTRTNSTWESYAERSMAARYSREGQLALEVATALYQRVLARTPVAQGYLAQRGITAAVAHAVRLGFCAGSGLIDQLRWRGVPLRVAWEVGLLVGREGRERFAQRLTIPEIRDGRVVWLTGRLLDDWLDAPRYMSLPGPRPLLGLARITAQPAAIGVEGPFDWLTLLGWGLPAFAALGDSFPPEAAEALAAARVVYLAFDGDAPGQQAARRIAARLGDRARIVELPPGITDPDVRA